MIARKFDKGYKNFLTGAEKEEAIEAVRNGFEDKFVWNIEAGGAMRPYRLQQVRGAIVDAEDYREVTNTYPKHPLSDIKPHAATMTDLTALRKKPEKEDIKSKKDARDAKVSHLQKV